MPPLSKDSSRVIIDNFTKDIIARKKKGPKPQKHVVDFRTDRIHGIERDVWLVPTELLRFRKDNGRIASDVLSYERAFGIIDETSNEGQEKIREFLYKKDPERTEDLKKSIVHQDQTDPAIITCDGFLINGNRRKMVMDLLKKEKGDAKFSEMKVVILPGKGEEGGEPTIKEIEQIENRYQMQKDTKAEYSGLDKALSMRRKIECGISLKEQLKDDPVNAGLQDKELERETKKCEEEFLEPLACVDRYLAWMEKEGEYSLVAEGLADREGRWQAFKDYSKYVFKKLKDPAERMELKINESEIGKIEDAAFKIIRRRDFKDVAKVHKIMRDLPKILMDKDAKKHLLALTGVSLNLPEEELRKSDGSMLTSKEIDKKWGSKHHETFMHRVRTAINIIQQNKIKETCLTLLDAALKKLTHDDMDPEQISLFDCGKAIKLLNEIEQETKELKSQFFHLEKKLKKLTDHNKN